MVTSHFIHEVTRASVRECLALRAWRLFRNVGRVILKLPQKSNQPTSDCASFLQLRQASSQTTQECIERRREMEKQRWEEERRLEEERHQEQLEHRKHHLQAPPHPDEQRPNDYWVPEQTMEITSGGFCFGLRHEAQEGAMANLQSFEDVAGNLRPRCHAPLTKNTAAKNGTWAAYKLHFKCENWGHGTTGWFLCHRDSIPNPLVELRRMIYDTFELDYGGGDLDGVTNMYTQPHHFRMGYLSIPRYALGTVYEFEEQEANDLLEEGLFVADYAHAQSIRDPEKWTNTFRGIHTCGDFNIGRLAYDDDGLCHAFLLVGNAVQFQQTYFTQGTAPLGQYEWQTVCFCENHGKDRTISVDEYCRQSKTTVCLNPPTQQEIRARLRAAYLARNGQQTTAVNGKSRPRKRRVSEGGQAKPKKPRKTLNEELPRSQTRITAFFKAKK